jgi:hypothetical protein
MSSQVRKNVNSPHNNLFHHGLIKLLFLVELEKQRQTWDEFIYQFANPHLTIKTGKNPLGLRTVSPSKPHSPRTPNFLAQTISLPEQYRILLKPLIPYRVKIPRVKIKRSLLLTPR